MHDDPMLRPFKRPGKTVSKTYEEIEKQNDNEVNEPIMCLNEKMMSDDENTSILNNVDLKFIELALYFQHKGLNEECIENAIRDLKSNGINNTAALVDLSDKQFKNITLNENIKQLINTAKIQKLPSNETLKESPKKKRKLNSTLFPPVRLCGDYTTAELKKYRVFQINRAPILICWSAICAKKLGYTWEESLSIGKSLSSYYAKVKGESLGIYKKTKFEPPKNG
eukprot:UN32213